MQRQRKPLPRLYSRVSIDYLQLSVAVRSDDPLRIFQSIPYAESVERISDVEVRVTVNMHTANQHIKIYRPGDPEATLGLVISRIRSAFQYAIFKYDKGEA